MNLRPEHLAAIKALVLSSARKIRAEGEECAPVLLLFNSTPAGTLGGMTGIALPPDKKDLWVAAQNRYARAPDIAAAVLINEGWQSMINPGEAIPTTTEGRERKEVFMVNVLSKDAQFLLVADINSGRIQDADFQKIEGGNYQGRFIRPEKENAA